MSVADTSVASYYELVKDGKISEGCRRIISALVEFGPMTDRQLSNILDWPPSQVAARRNDLMNDKETGFVVFSGRYYKDPDTKKKVRVWRENLSPQPSLL